MTERLKLKRGLAHISPLFSGDGSAMNRIQRHAESAVVPRAVSDPKIYYIWSSDDEADNHFLNNFFASKLVSPESPGYLVTFEDSEASPVNTIRSEAWNQFLKRVSLPAACLQDVFAQDGWVPHEDNDGFQPRQVFIEMKMDLLLRHPELLRLLDHLVLFVKPQVDSVTETYRKLKRFAAAQLKADIAVVFDADHAGGLPAKIYELFSDFVSRRLSLSMNYWGTLHLSRGGSGLAHDLRWSSAGEIPSWQRTSSIEKLRFLTWVEKVQMPGALR